MAEMMPASCETKRRDERNPETKSHHPYLKFSSEIEQNKVASRSSHDGDADG